MLINSFSFYISFDQFISISQTYDSLLIYARTNRMTNSKRTIRLSNHKNKKLTIKHNYTKIMMQKRYVHDVTSAKKASR